MAHPTLILKLVCIIVISVTICLSYILWRKPNFSTIYHNKDDDDDDESSKENWVKYEIKTSNCKIPSLKPVNSDVIQYFHPQEYSPCSTKEPLTYIEKGENGVTLKINRSLLHTYSNFEIYCCYSIVTPVRKFNESDNDISFSDCKYFQDSVTITDFHISVECRTTLLQKIYSNVHSIIDPSIVKSPREITENNEHDDKFNVILVGIDSVSKLNLIRTMPKTYGYLENHKNYLRLKGYTKIADNTLPNLLAILTGQNREQFWESHNPDLRHFDKSGLIFEQFQAAGYLTAYGEDETAMGTFNQNLKGFHDPPFDFYFRPYFIAAEKLSQLWRRDKGMHYCTGPSSTGERMLDLVKNYLKLKNRAKFGLFWMNSFSHNDINAPSTMDGKFLTFFKEIDEKLNDTILIFFSDHGFRFGPMRRTYTGWLEERQPFILIHLPENFRNLYPEKVKNLEINTERLTTPYDVFMTLQDLLKGKEKSEGCPQCRSLFQEVPENRNCKDASISEHWCLCSGYQYENPSSEISVKLANFVVFKLNSLIKSYGKVAENCWSYDLKNVVSVGKSENYINSLDQNVIKYLVTIRTLPVALFEATVEFNQHFKLLGEISRINRYKDKSSCIDEPLLRKYCYCNNLFGTVMKAVCTLVNCL